MTSVLVWRQDASPTLRRILFKALKAQYPATRDEGDRLVIDHPTSAARHLRSLSAGRVGA